MSVFQSPEDLSGYLFRIVDNGGSTADRYTVVFSDGSYIGMSGAPTHPQGVSMWGEDIDPATVEGWVENGEAVDLALGDLPEDLIRHILDRNNEGLRDFLESVEAKDPVAVAPDRDSAEVNEGTSGCLGKGIYWTEEGYRIRLDGWIEDDLGPFASAREAILASLPDEHGFSGPEYHSSLDVMRLEPDPEVAAKVAKLEARREAEWMANRTSPLS